MRTAKRRARDFAALTAIVATVGVAAPTVAHAQITTTSTLCTPGALANCATMRLTALYGGGSGGTTLFTISLQNLGSEAIPTLATTIYNLAFSTGQTAFAPGSEIFSSVMATAEGSAVVFDPTAWQVVDTGDFMFLGAVNGNGVGGCIAGSPVGGFSQLGQTCAPDDFFAFSFSTPNLYDPSSFSLIDYEVVGLTDALPGDFCGDAVACPSPTPPVTATPEPTSIVLTASGLFALAVTARRRRYEGTRDV